MRIMAFLACLAAFVTLAAPPAPAGDEPRPAAATAEARAQAALDAAEKAAREAEAAVAPLRAALQKADAAYAAASKAAATKRQQATDARNLAGEPGAKELKQAEADVPAAVKALTDATNAIPALHKAVDEARAAARPLQQAYEAAEKEAQQARAAAKAAADAANKFDDEARTAAAQAAALRRTVATARATLAQARASEPVIQKQAAAAAERLAGAVERKGAADAALTAARKQATAATQAATAAEKAAQAAAARAKQGAADAGKTAADKKQAADQAAASRKAADAARAAVPVAQTAVENAQKRVEAAARALTEPAAQKKQADAALAEVREGIAAAQKAIEAGEPAILTAAKAAEEKKALAAQATARRQPARDAAAAVEQAQAAEQQALVRVNAAAKLVAEAMGPKQRADTALAAAKKQVAAAAQALAAAEKAAQRPTVDAARAALAKAQQAEKQAQAAAPLQKWAEAQAQKKAADTALAGARAKIAAATAAYQAARDAVGELARLDEDSRQAAAEAAAKRRAADVARFALAPVQRKLEQAMLDVTTAAQNQVRAEARKKAAEEALESLKKRIALARETYLADEKAAKEAEDAALPLKAEADRAQAAHAAAARVAESRRAAAEQAKAALYRLNAARQVASLMESPLPPVPANRIDDITFAALKAAGLRPVLCSDAIFVRRAHLDLTGRLPSADEARAFIQSTDKNKRTALVDRLLDQPAHVDYWAMKWSDILRIKAEFPVKLWPNAAQAYYRWVWESVAKNKPYDQFARELLTSSGSNFRVGPVNFYRAIQDRTPDGIGAAVGLALMGTRVQLWPEARRAGLTPFFAQVGYKPTSEWKEEIVFWDPLGTTALPGCNAPGVDSIAQAVKETNQVPRELDKPIRESGPRTAVFPDGTKVTIPPDRDPRTVFADWLIRPDNPWFARAAVNRTWAWVMGRGIIHEPDDLRDDNPPASPELLAYLEKELVSSRYDLKHLRRLIFTSTTYQLAPVARPSGPDAKALFATYKLRRVEAEVLNDVINQVTGSTDLYTSAVPEPFSYMPKDMSAVEVADGSITSSFLTLFGRSARATGMESERVNELASPQWLFMLNSGEVQNKLQTSPKLAALVTPGGKPREIAEKLYLTILSRFPTEADLKTVDEYATVGGRGREVWTDLAWALINSPEFLVRH